LPVSVTIGGQAAQVLYAGAAPGQVAGVLQINAVVPDGAGLGPVFAYVTVGSKSSPSAAVTISIR
jgi:uncharacterized protein (TIGR03437 family)